MMARARGWQPGASAEEPGDVGLIVPAHPNPFGQATTLVFSLAKPGAVRLDIVDAGGRLVAILVDAHLAACRHEFTWAGRTASGQLAPAGVYFARLAAPGNARTERVVLVR
jgi:hypothetical protein